MILPSFISNGTVLSLIDQFPDPGSFSTAVYRVTTQSKAKKKVPLFSVTLQKKFGSVGRQKFFFCNFFFRFKIENPLFKLISVTLPKETSLAFAFEISLVKKILPFSPPPHMSHTLTGQFGTRK